MARALKSGLLLADQSASSSKLVIFGYGRRPKECCSADVSAYTSQVAVPDRLQRDTEVEILLEGFPDEIILPDSNTAAPVDFSPTYVDPE